LVFDAAPGPALVVALIDLGNRFRLVANTIEVVAPPHPLPKLPVARALWQPQPSFAIATEAWLLAGGAHHTVFTSALSADILEDFAAIAGTELVLIDATTSLREFRRELLWSDAAYRLALR
jgi:L-arabinose isomerase